MYSEKIKEIRSKLNLSVAKMSEKIDIPQRTITGYERGERSPSIEFLAQICKILNVNINWFLTNEGEMFKKDVPQFEQVKGELLGEVRQMLKDEGLIK